LLQTLSDSMKATTRRIIWCGSLVLILFMALLVSEWISHTGKTLTSVRIPDGKILQIEGVTYGKAHQIGAQSILNERFGRWMPQKVRQLLEPERPRSRMDLEQPALVVWLNAIDPATGKPVDCQGVRLEFIDKHGDLFGAADSSWSAWSSGGATFSRIGHVFHAFPRDESKLTLRLTPWRTQEFSAVEISNPHLTRPKEWSGSALPQQRKVGHWEIVLTGLTMRTNGGRDKSWETPARY